MTEERTIRREVLSDGQVVEVDRGYAQRCDNCGQRRHFVEAGVCRECRTAAPFAADVIER